MKAHVDLPANIGGSAGIEASKEEIGAVTKFFSQVIPGFIKDGVGIVNDNVRFARFRNMAKIAVKADKIRKRYKLNESNELSLKIGQTFIEGVTVEEEPVLQEMWAFLLANTNEKNSDINIIFASILRELTPIEARVINTFYLDSSNDKQNQIQKSKNEILEFIKKDNPSPELILDNLFRHQLIQTVPKQNARLPRASTFVNYGGDGTYSARSRSFGTLDKTDENFEQISRYLREEEDNIRMSTNFLQLTQLGLSLVKSCNEPNSK